MDLDVLEVLAQSGLECPGSARAGLIDYIEAHKEQVGVDPICRVDLIELTEDELAGLTSAVAPVLEDMRKDESAAGYLAQIMAIKGEQGAPPDTFTC